MHVPPLTHCTKISLAILMDSRNTYAQSWCLAHSTPDGVWQWCLSGLNQQQVFILKAVLRSFTSAFPRWHYRSQDVNQISEFWLEFWFVVFRLPCSHLVKKCFAVFFVFFYFKLTYVLLDIAILELFPELNKVQLTFISKRPLVDIKLCIFGFSHVLREKVQIYLFLIPVFTVSKMGKVTCYLFCNYTSPEEKLTLWATPLRKSSVYGTRCK